jgi:hypothetical protein
LQVENWTEKYKKKGLEYKDLLDVYQTCQQHLRQHTEEEVGGGGGDEGEGVEGRG